MNKNYPLNVHPKITNLKQLIYMQAENKPYHPAFQYMRNQQHKGCVYGQADRTFK